MTVRSKGEGDDGQGDPQEPKTGMGVGAPAQRKSGSDDGQGDPQDPKTGLGVLPDGRVNAYALLIGVGECAYPKWSLEVTVRDAEALRGVLVDPQLCAYPEERVRLLTNAQATRAGILKAVNDLARDTAGDQDATVFVYYSGHGWRQSGGSYYLVPHDVVPHKLAATAVPAEDFIQALQGLQSRRVFILADTCHAEGMAKDVEADLPEGFGVEPPPEALIAELKSGEGRAVFLSCRGQQKSWIGEGPLSLFTRHLVEALRGDGRSPGERVVKLSHVMDLLSDRVPESAKALGQVQTPYFRMAAEDYGVAMIRGGKGVGAGGDAAAVAPPAEKPHGNQVRVGNIHAGRDVLTVGGNVGNLTTGGS